MTTLIVQNDIGPRVRKQNIYFWCYSFDWRDWRGTWNALVWIRMDNTSNRIWHCSVYLHPLLWRLEGISFLGSEERGRSYKGITWAAKMDQIAWDSPHQWKTTLKTVAMKVHTPRVCRSALGADCSGASPWSPTVALAGLVRTICTHLFVFLMSCFIRLRPRRVVWCCVLVIFDLNCLFYISVVSVPLFPRRFIPSFASSVLLFSSLFIPSSSYTPLSSFSLLSSVVNCTVFQQQWKKSF